MVSIKSLLLSVLALSSGIDAKRHFYNSGKLKGWDSRLVENQGSIKEVKGESYRSGRSLQITQTYEDKYRGLYRSMLTHKNGYERGDQRFYGFTFKLDPDWEPVDQNATILQFVSNRDSGRNCGIERLTSFKIYVLRDFLYVSMVSGELQGSKCQMKETKFERVAKIQPGAWHKVLFEVKWETRKRPGFIHVFFDGRIVVGKDHIPTTVGGNWPFVMQIGLDMSDWHDKGMLLGSQLTRQLWIDEITIATRYREVDPDQRRPQVPDM